MWVLCCPTLCRFARGEIKIHLLNQIAVNALFLSEDPYGNYVVQHVIDGKKPHACAILIQNLQGYFVSLSMNKYGSNVVEKCLNELSKDQSKGIIIEIMTSRDFLTVLQDPFGNFVAQTALLRSQDMGQLHDTLVDLILRHYPFLNSHPHGKRVLARARDFKNNNLSLRRPTSGSKFESQSIYFGEGVINCAISRHVKIHSNTFSVSIFRKSYIRCEFFLFLNALNNPLGRDLFYATEPLGRLLILEWVVVPQLGAQGHILARAGFGVRDERYHFPCRVLGFGNKVGMIVWAFWSPRRVGDSTHSSATQCYGLETSPPPLDPFSSDVYEKCYDWFGAPKLFYGTTNAMAVAYWIWIQDWEWRLPNLAIDPYYRVGLVAQWMAKDARSWCDQRESHFHDLAENNKMRRDLNKPLLRLEKIKVSETRFPRVSATGQQQEFATVLEEKDTELGSLQGGGGSSGVLGGTIGSSSQSGCTWAWYHN
ncbi:LOW QUALITY PROTEIN: Pumilio RNA-binding repeat [Dillenia turbinata]|uniref:Pumilio RNA-binding repeat n=1 Tax=Dillenia turbinata TaxID=194707 RepID=A0AAN8YX68_9MAGN